MNGRYAYFILLISLIFAASCARPVLPGGGDKDTTPPKLIQAKSTAPKQTNFQIQPISFTFDEFILLDKADQQTLISPPLTYRPTISLKDKTVNFKFDEREVLKENTTYIINFGESIKDYTEGNIAPDMQFVFSTGDHIDSLELSATITNADEAKPAEKTVLMLYRDLSDSAVYKVLPDYAARTDKNGAVNLRYMQPGTYQAVALKDENQNYKYDLTNEKAGFVAENITLPYTGQPLNIQIFAKEPPVKISAVDSSSNQRIRLVFDPSAAGVTVKPLDPNDGAVIDVGIKNIDIYFADTLRKVGFVVNRPGFAPDTIQKQLSKKVGIRKFRMAEEQQDIKSFPFVPGQPVHIYMNSKIVSIDREKIMLHTANTTTPLDFEIKTDTTNTSKLVLESRWAEDSSYVLDLKAGALIDKVSNRNDSLSIRFKIADPSTLGSITMRIDSLNPAYDYSIQLAKGNELIRKWIVKGQSSFSTEINGIPAETYEINILEDRNRNGRIDKGNFATKELPENIYTKKLEQLRQNWSIDVEINMNEFRDNE